MSYKIIPTPRFKADAKSLERHYHSFKDDIGNLTEYLKVNPLIGDYSIR